MVRLTRAQVREVDRLAIEQYHVPGVVLMENAARAVAAEAWRMLSALNSRRVLVLCGGGNNGGDAFAAARHLHNRGADITLALVVEPSRLKGDALANWRIAEAMNLRALPLTPELVRASDAALLIDAIFGTGLTEAPRDPFAAIVAAVNQHHAPRLAVDLPSGLDCDTGLPLGPAIRATRTVTFVAEKTGFANPASRAFTGEVLVADIGCPREIVEGLLRHGSAP